MSFNTVPRRKDINTDLREANVAAHQSQKGLSDHFQIMWRTSLKKSIHKLKHSTHLPVFSEGDIPASSPQGQSAKLRETAKSQRATSQCLQVSVSISNVDVRDCTIRKRLNKCG